VNLFGWRRPHLPATATGQELLDDYVAAEDALRAFTDRNFGRMCAICARWTLYAAQVNAEAEHRQETDDVSVAPTNAPAGSGPPASVPTAEPGAPPLTWRLQSWVANCCNANHALESMSDESLAGVVASREAGREWWRTVERAAQAPCAALTETGCALKRGRPELCNRYFCEGVRDYLWALGGDGHGAALAAQLDDLQRRWASLYAAYQEAIRQVRSEAAAERIPRAPAPARLTNVQYRRRQRLRTTSHWDDFFHFLDRFDAAIAQHARAVSADEMTDRFFKVNGDRNAYVPFFVQEVAAIGGRIRAD
jgi:hypothetical protein